MSDDAPEMTTDELRRAYMASEKDKSSNKETRDAVLGLVILAPFFAAYIGFLCGVVGGICVNIFRWITR